MEHMAVFDTNILIDLFNNRVEAANTIENTVSHRSISLITWMEVMVGARKHGHEAKTAAVMGAFEIIDVTREIAERSVVLREKHGMKLPDAIILATAQSRNCPLITRNTKDFQGIPGVVSPYQL
ncbi:type II toxin-antitoxin system VapC family toxin [Enterobacter cloacae]|uniref:type II toxin-antitoxin system VapC family toxin n=1 Tax=Enterobacter cloacae complex TaxID=354276 RepID=UPI00210B6B85|nr:MULTISPECIES: type II toxin-antitoxin system VapC family toxin [Enterobacter cloacae complex]MCQ4447068.1 type II toxin-antitoxin system VapC family toxin [Enterobacter cloacae]MDW2867899.1 type II toxin-antitoxin system VapC family toxin [Enterobacter hormaechei]